jgi:transcription initiation factor TFIIIB Brf1 subunit/transcription initiation factor TFIIB
LKTLKTWKCECGNEDQRKIIIAADGEVVCEKCGTVLGQVKIKSVSEEQIDRWDGEADLCRTLLEEHVSKRGWEF